MESHKTDQPTKSNSTQRKWGKIVSNFIDSDCPVVKIVDIVDARGSSHCLYQYLRNKDYPIRWFRNQNDIYLFRSDIPTLSLEDAILNHYPKSNEKVTVDEVIKEELSQIERAIARVQTRLETMKGE